jgi:SAM-dependent methyltransferase
MNRQGKGTNFRTSIRTIGRKMIGTQGVSFLRKYWHATVPDFATYRKQMSGRRALEIGGPSEIFSDHGSVPVYPVLAGVDNCLFSARTIWTGKVNDSSYVYHPKKKPGVQLFCDATGLTSIRSSIYEAVLASHCLEHVANPLRALKEWKRVLSDDGTLLLILPHKEGTFDWRRPVTSIAHMVRDDENNVGEDDLTHLPEILALHDLQKDAAAGSPEQFKERCLANPEIRAMHHHVFDTPAAAALVDRAGFQMLRVAAIRPFHIIVLAQKCSRPIDNSMFLGSDAEFRMHSPYASDRRLP